jgi:hypothetical protein
VGENFDYGKKGEFLAHDQFHLQKQTKWWQRMIQICQIIVKNNLTLICIDVALILVAF